VIEDPGQQPNQDYDRQDSSAVENRDPGEDGVLWPQDIEVEGK